MTTYIHRIVYDAGLHQLARTELRLAVLSAFPADYASVAGLTLGEKVSIVISGPSNSGSGRKVTVAAVTDGVITKDGIAQQWCIVDDRVARLLVVGDLLAPKTLVVGNVFSLQAFDIVLPGVPT